MFKGRHDRRTPDRRSLYIDPQSFPRHEFGVPAKSSFSDAAVERGYGFDYPQHFSTLSWVSR